MNSPTPDSRAGQCAVDIESVLDYIHHRYTGNISRETIAGALNVDPILLGTDFKAATGKSLKQYINQLRLDHAYRLLFETQDKIIDIAYEAGFESLRTFNRVFSNAMGDTPSNYRKHYRSKHKPAVRSGKLR
jgi:two-component system, response regulator YesN